MHGQNHIKSEVFTQIKLNYFEKRCIIYLPLDIVVDIKSDTSTFKNEEDYQLLFYILVALTRDEDIP